MGQEAVADFPLYHERQRYSLCLKHTLNNLLQAPHFTKGDLDQIAHRLTPTKLRLFNPHATILGNHDVNVLTAALQDVGLELKWHDVRDTSFCALDISGCWGLIVNRESSNIWSRMLGALAARRHWYGMRRFHGAWYLLDSGLQEPWQLTDGDEREETLQLREFLQSQLEMDSSMLVLMIYERTEL